MGETTMNRIVPGVFAALILLPGLARAEGAADATFHKDILPIFQQSCQVCHRPGGANLGGMVAPMSFTTYEETRPWAKSIAEQVGSRQMPPWHAAPEHHGVFENERTLTQEEIDLIVAWANTGAKAGNPADAPAPMTWPNADGWLIGEPDLILRPDEPYFVGDDVSDYYVDLKTTMTPELLPEDRYIKAMEFRPGGPVVHHIIMTPIGAGIAPGNDPTVYPDGVGKLLRAGEDLEWQMHYNKEPGPGTGVWEHSQVAIKFYDDPSEVTHVLQGNSLGRYDFLIPAGEPAYTVQKEYVFKHDSRIISLLPHFHLRGAAAKYEAIYPDGRHEVLLDVPKYDFNWQTTFRFREFKEVPAGTKILFTSVFDNSTANPDNPNPAEDVRWGNPTYAEMSYGYMMFINEAEELEHVFDDEENDLTALVAFMDENIDGVMDAEEVKRMPQVAGFFPMMDLNKDGVVDMKEARAASIFMKAMQQNRAKDAAAEAQPAKETEVEGAG
jgi:mono/diheme cytochrome c family protein